MEIIHEAKDLKIKPLNPLEDFDYSVKKA